MSSESGSKERVEHTEQTVLLGRDSFKINAQELELFEVRGSMTLIVRSMCVERCHFKALSHTLPQAIITTILGLSQTQTMKLREVKLSESLPKILPPKQSLFHHVSHCHLMSKHHGPAFTWTSRAWVRSVPGPDFFAF